MGKLIFYLKQHTPMLHFQHGQSGATLRATEVKPKLDKFITKKAGTESDFGLCKIDGKDALDYKMRIEVCDTNRTNYHSESKKEEYWVCSNLNTEGLNMLPNMPKIIASSPYFAQEEAVRKIVTGGKDQKTFQVEAWDNIDKKGLMWPILSISFFSLNQKVLYYIQKYIEEFFICTNFGTRNNKGFGCFTVCDEKGLRTCPKDTFEEVLTGNFDFVYKKEEILFQNVFSTIASDYRLIKSGRNKPYYAKSGFYAYAESKKYRWDKPFIKSGLSQVLKDEGEGLRLRGRDSARDVSNCKCIRPFLGMTDNYMFQLENIRKNISKKDFVKVKCPGIERFPSPLLFKFFGNCIYLVGRKDDIKIIKNKTFSFYYGKTCFGSLDTPNDFDLEDFLDYVFKDKYPNRRELNYQKL